MNEDLEHMKHVGSKIIDEHRRENALLKNVLKEAGIHIPGATSDSKDDRSEELTKSEEQKLKEYYAMRQK